MRINLDPSYVITGNHPVAMRESLLPQVFDMGDNMVEAAEKLGASRHERSILSPDNVHRQP